MVDRSEVNKGKAGTEIFPTVVDGKKPAIISVPENKYVFRYEYEHFFFAIFFYVFLCYCELLLLIILFFFC